MNCCLLSLMPLLLDASGTDLNPTRLVIAAVVGLILLLVLIIKFKIQAMIAILVGAILISLWTMKVINGPPFSTVRELH